MSSYKKREYDNSEVQHVQKKLFNLVKAWRFNVMRPWYIPVEEIRNYYGEKVALYFHFLAHYTQQLVVISAFGIACFVVQRSFLDKSPGYVFTGMGFGVVKTFWASYSYYSWQREEKIFATRFGQLDNQKSGNSASQEERPGFKGSFM